MSATDLRFFKRQPVTTALRFNEIPPPGVDIYSAATIDASVTVSVAPNLTTRVGYLATIDAAVDVGFEANLTALYDNSVNRGPFAWERSAWESASPCQLEVSSVHEVAPKREHAAAVPYLPGAHRRAEIDERWGWMSMAPRPCAVMPWGDASDRNAHAAVPHAELSRANRPAPVALWRESAHLPADAADSWIDLLRHRRPEPRLLWAEARRASLILAPAFGTGRAIRLYTRIPWQQGRHPPPGVTVVIVIPPGHVPCYNPQPGDPVNLRFWELLSTVDLDLRFRCPNADGSQGETIVIPVRRIYMQTNTITIIVANTGQPIVSRNLRLSLDSDSWVWGWSASVSADHLDVLSPSGGGQVELIATLNGTAFRLAVERIRRDRSFGKSALAISGRGRAAWLADPYAAAVTRTNVEAMTAQQLMADALTENGVSIGWDIDWQITDWLVPAGAWSHTGTAMDACLTIAAAAGAYIQAHRTSQILSVLPRYPSAPWTWASVTPDIQIPEDVCVTEGIEWLDKPDYNTVFISGQTGGILAHVTRGGTAGDKPAQMITDPLITHADAGRQRGTAILADTGRQKLISLSLPVLPETGIIVPGQFVRYNEGGNQHIGLTRAVEVLPDFPKLRQTITVESHVL